jgi:hypothetical protein
LLIVRFCVGAAPRLVLALAEVGLELSFKPCLATFGPAAPLGIAVRHPEFLPDSRWILPGEYYQLDPFGGLVAVSRRFAEYPRANELPPRPG